MAELIERVARQLRQPVPVSGDFDARLARKLDAAPKQRWWIAGAAGLAAVLAGLTVVGSRAVQGGQHEVQLVIELPGAATVSVVGDFNDWDRSRTQLARVASSNEWRTTIAVRDGVYRYAFLVDGVEWIADPARPAAADMDFGGTVSVLAID